MGVLSYWLEIEPAPRTLQTSRETGSEALAEAMEDMRRQSAATAVLVLWWGLSVSLRAVQEQMPDDVEA
jgi:hypothetical protein